MDVLFEHLDSFRLEHYAILVAATLAILVAGKAFLLSLKIAYKVVAGLLILLTIAGTGLLLWRLLMG